MQFNEQEVELLISGTPDIDVDEWRAATEYHGYNASDTAIVWWWRALKSFSREERAKVLSFATGTSRVPLGGFADLQGVHGVQKFSIHRAYGASDRLPQAHTCEPYWCLPTREETLTVTGRLQPDRPARIHVVREAAPTAPVRDQRGWRGLRVRVSMVRPRIISYPDTVEETRHGMHVPDCSCIICTSVSDHTSPTCSTCEVDLSSSAVLGAKG
jgi:hypothetical protein